MGKTAAQRQSDYRKRHPQRVAASKRACRERHKEQIAAYARDYRRRNKEAIRAREKAWREANRDHVLAYSREYERANREHRREARRSLSARLAARIRGAHWYAKNPSRGRAKQHDWHMNNIDKARRQGRESERRRRERRFGYSYSALESEQGGRCAICGSTESGWMRNGRPSSFHVDHDHVTGAIRGLLCHPCNSALGLFRDNPATLRAAADYLDRTASAPVFVAATRVQTA